jgi:hypothetical protein
MITAEQYEQATGDKPENDDLERCNCERAGQPGHYFCGWNTKENLPVFMVGPTSDGHAAPSVLTQPLA